MRIHAKCALGETCTAVHIHIVYSWHLHLVFDENKRWRAGKYRFERSNLRTKKILDGRKSVRCPIRERIIARKDQKCQQFKNVLYCFGRHLYYYLGMALSTTVRLLPSPVWGTPLQFLSEQTSFNINVTAETVAISRGRLIIVIILS